MSQKPLTSNRKSTSFTAVTKTKSTSKKLRHKQRKRVREEEEQELKAETINGADLNIYI